MVKNSKLLLQYDSFQDYTSDIRETISEACRNRIQNLFCAIIWFIISVRIYEQLNWSKSQLQTNLMLIVSTIKGKKMINTRQAKQKMTWNYFNYIFIQYKNHILTTIYAAPMHIHVECEVRKTYTKRALCFGANYPI